MKILAPVSNYESACYMIDAGAKEIYLGMDDTVFEKFSFTGRGKKSNEDHVTLVGYDEFKEIVDYAHNKGVFVNYLGNMPCFSDFKYEQSSFEKKYINYIEKGISAGVDSVVIGDIGLLNEVCKQHYSVEIHASVYFRSINAFQLKFFREIGVKRVTLSYQVLMSEIEKFCTEKIVDLEVIGYLGCSFFNGACSFFHEYGEGGNCKKIPGVMCKNFFKIGDDIQDKIFDVETGCSLCNVKRLDEMGVAALKIVGRDRNYKNTAQVVEMFNKVLKNNYYDCTNEIVPLWWKKVWCENRSCKYSEKSKNYQYIIGK